MSMFAWRWVPRDGTTDTTISAYTGLLAASLRYFRKSKEIESADVFDNEYRSFSTNMGLNI